MQSNLTCSLCQRLLKRPVQTTNGHRFCEGCLLGTSRTARYRCRLCVEDAVPEELDCFNLGIESVFGDRAVVYDIYKLEAWCKVCGCVANYLEIMKNHIKKPCHGRECYQYIYKLFYKLTDIYQQCSSCNPPRR